MNGRVVKGSRGPILYSVGLDKPPGHKIYKDPITKLFRKLNKSVFISYHNYLQDNDYIPVDFNGKTISSTCPY